MRNVSFNFVHKDSVSVCSSKITQTMFWGNSTYISTSGLNHVELFDQELLYNSVTLWISSCRIQSWWLVVSFDLRKSLTRWLSSADLLAAEVSRCCCVSFTLVRSTCSFVSDLVWSTSGSMLEFGSLWSPSPVCRRWETPAGSLWSWCRLCLWCRILSWAWV